MDGRPPERVAFARVQISNQRRYHEQRRDRAPEQRTRVKSLRAVGVEGEVHADEHRDRESEEPGVVEARERLHEKKDREAEPRLPAARAQEPVQAEQGERHAPRGEEVCGGDLAVARRAEDEEHSPDDRGDARHAEVAEEERHRGTAEHVRRQHHAIVEVNRVVAHERDRHRDRQRAEVLHAEPERVRKGVRHVRVHHVQRVGQHGVGRPREPPRDEKRVGEPRVRRDRGRREIGVPHVAYEWPGEDDRGDAEQRQEHESLAPEMPTVRVHVVATRAGLVAEEGSDVPERVCRTFESNRTAS